MTEPVRISDRDVHALLRIVTGEREHDVARGCPCRCWRTSTSRSPAMPCRSSASTAGRKTPGSARTCPQTRGKTIRHSGRTTGTPSRAPTPTAAAICAA